MQFKFNLVQVQIQLQFKLGWIMLVGVMAIYVWLGIYD